MLKVKNSLTKIKRGKSLINYFNKIKRLIELLTIKFGNIKAI